MRGRGRRVAVGREANHVDPNELIYAKGVLLRLAQAARSDRDLARHIRDLILSTEILHVFGVDEITSLIELLEAGGVTLLRARLSELPLAELKQIVETNRYDPEKTTARWRSAARFVDLIVERAVAQWEQMDRALVNSQRLDPATEAAASQPKVANGASWML
jgi:hypothetical protein